MEAFADVVRAGKALYIGVSGVDGVTRSARRTRWPASCSIPLVSNQPQYSMLWRVIEAEVVPTCEELGIGQIVWSPIAQGVLTGKYLPGQPPPEGSRATDDKSGAGFISRLHAPTRCSSTVQKLRPLAEQAGLTDGPAGGRVGAAEPERLVGHRRRDPSGTVAGQCRRRPASSSTPICSRRSTR